ncbi:hypothetical protein GCM10027451_44120 [Geodermatophilus aquaeductus]
MPARADRCPAERATPTTVSPRDSATRAIASPKPELAPVTNHVRGSVMTGDARAAPGAGTRMLLARSRGPPLA